jgi:hypothetical protein
MEKPRSAGGFMPQKQPLPNRNWWVTAPVSLSPCWDDSKTCSTLRPTFSKWLSSRYPQVPMVVTLITHPLLASFPSLPHFLHTLTNFLGLCPREITCAWIFISGFPSKGIQGKMDTSLKCSSCARSQLLLRNSNPRLYYILGSIAEYTLEGLSLLAMLNSIL